jgi:hypothetical protein
LALEAAIFGNVGNGLFNSFYNFWNTVLGTGEATINSLLGVQVPAGLLTGSLVVGTSPTIGGGALGGMLAAVPTKFLWDINVIGAPLALLGGAGPLQTALTAAGLQTSLGAMINGSVPLGTALVAAPVAGLQGIGNAELGLFNNLVGAETTFNTSLLANEVALGASVSGPGPFNGALNRAFNIGNLVVATGEQTVNSFLGGTQGTALFLTGGPSVVFDGGNIGGIEGAFNQSLALGADLAGML